MKTFSLMSDPDKMITKKAYGEYGLFLGKKIIGLEYEGDNSVMLNFYKTELKRLEELETALEDELTDEINAGPGDHS